MPRTASISSRDFGCAAAVRGSPAAANGEPADMIDQFRREPDQADPGGHIAVIVIVVLDQADGLAGAIESGRQAAGIRFACGRQRSVVSGGVRHGRVGNRHVGRFGWYKLERPTMDRINGATDWGTDGSVALEWKVVEPST